MKLRNAVVGLVGGLLLATQATAVPLPEAKITYVKNHSGTYTYFIRIENSGPIAPRVATPPGHMAYGSGGTAYPAGGKSLADDENLVFFGVDTNADDLTISDITNGGTLFHGTEERGWADSNGNGVKNQVVAWHLPFYGWTTDDTIRPSDAVMVTFTLNREVSGFNVWAGGSDDATIWVDGHEMVEDEFGIFDATDGEYLATLTERTADAKQAHGRKRCFGQGGNPVCVLWDK